MRRTAPSRAPCDDGKNAGPLALPLCIGTSPEQMLDLCTSNPEALRCGLWLSQRHTHNGEKQGDSL